MICKKCGNVLEDGDLFCGECGCRVESENPAGGGAVCPKCGNAANPGDTFCGICGSMLGSTNMRQNGASVYPAQPGDAIKSFGKQFEAPDKEKPNTPLIIVAAVLLAAVIAGIVICLMLFLGGKPKSADNSANQTASNTPAETVAPALAETAVPIPTIKPAPMFTTAQASSIRSTDSLGGTYSVESVLTQDNMTKWVPSKSSGNGIGQWIQVSAATPQYVKGIYVLNGYHKNAETWRKNNRVQSCTITFSDGQSRGFVLSDSMDLIALDLGYEVTTYSIRLTINSVYRGTEWNDTAVTYLGAY